MSSGGNAKAASGLGSIPAASRKVVQSVKEIVNCPEAEIYAMLRECNMDPNEAVSRLLTQGSFREVKSKREKKKENKDATEYKPRGAGYASNRGGRSGTDRRTASTQYNYSESGNMHERPAYKKENGAYSHIGANSSGPLAANTHVNRNVPAFSESVPKENKLTTPSESFPTPYQPSSGFQSSWGGGTAGQMSMADIVKKGIPQVKAPSSVNSAQYGNRKHVTEAPPPVLPHYTLHPSNDHTLSGSGPVAHSNKEKDEWPVMEPLPASTFPPVNATEIRDATTRYISGTNPNIKSEDSPLPYDGAEDNNNEVHGSTAAANEYLQEDNFGDTSYYENSGYEDPSQYEQYEHGREHEEAEDNSTSLSNVASGMQQLSLEKEGPVKEETRSVVIPDHLQVQSSECLNLSFGSFGAGIAAGLSATSATGPLNSDVEQQSDMEDASPDYHSDFRNPEYNEDEQSRSVSPEDLINRSGVTAETHSSISPSQPEVLKQDIPSEAEVAHYASHNLSGYNNLENTHQQQLNAAYIQSLTSSQGHNPPQFSNVMAYANFSPASLLAQQPVRESDLYSQFHANQTMAAKFGNQGAVGGSSTSGAEDLETTNLNPSQQVIPSTSNPLTGPGLSQHLAAMHPYSQPNLPLGPFTNMMGYPFMPQSYTYMPSAFQQAFGGNSSYHQSLAAMLPQYKNNLSGAGNSSNVPGNFSLHQNPASGGSSVGYDELINAYYKEQLLALQQAQLQLQHENSAMYAQGTARTMPTVPANTYYNFQGQNQQSAGVFRQNQQQQQPSQHFGSPGYPNFYHSQSGMSMEQHQQQNLRDGSLGGSQVQPPKQTQQQMWQNGY